MNSDTSLNKEKLCALLKDMESELIERTTSISDTDKFGQVICAFSNDLPNHKQNGYLLIGINDDGSFSGLKANDKILQRLGGIRSEGNILPQPIMSVKSFSYDAGDIVVIEVTPSPFPPVRYKGKTWIRTGPRKSVAGEMEERILIERRSANVTMFDSRPCVDSTIDDIDTDTFLLNYLPLAIDHDVLASDKRMIREKLAAMRFYNMKFDNPTNAAILVFGKNPVHFIYGCYIQYVRFKGDTVAGDILNEKKFTGNLFQILKEIELFIDVGIIQKQSVPESTLKEKTVFNYPQWAIRELLMNAIMHRDYESNAPIKFYHFDQHIEISNAGGLFGKANPENFPDENDYRNPIIAEAMKVMGYVNRFNRGIARVKQLFKENDNPEAVFKFSDISSFSVMAKCRRDKVYQESSESTGNEYRNLNQYIEEFRNIFGINSEYFLNKYNETELAILVTLFKNPTASARFLANQMNLSSRTVENHIKSLKNKRFIIRVGSKKTGHWKVIAENLKSGI